MGRPHIEFIEVAGREPVAWDVPGFGGHAVARRLSRDAETGATTEAVELPACFRAPAGCFAADVEIFSLSGRVRIGDYRLGRHSYTHIPAGVRVGPWEAADGASLLWMSAGAPRFSAADGHAPGARLDRYLPCMDSAAMSWVASINPGIPPGAMRKLLRQDPETGGSTWLLGVLPQWRESRIEIHPVVEEAYVISGDITTDRGRMLAGAYFWRPPHVPHGPLSTETGVLMLLRTDGPLQTSYLLEDRA